MTTRKLAQFEVSSVGMGCMGFTHAYGKAPEEAEGIRLVHLAFERGCTLFDTAEMYSYFKNEEFVGKALKELPRDRVVISDKFWPEKLPGHDFAEPKLSETGIRKALEGSLRRLGTDYIDIYIEHQMEDGSEESVAEIMGKLVKEGKIRGWGQSSSTPEKIRKAHAVAPLSVIQSEYSMMERKWEADVLPLCRELGIGFEAFSPIGNGFLSGKYTASMTYVGDNVRRAITRFAKENVIANQPLLDALEKLSQAKGCTKAQLALAWMLAKWPHVVPIPGMRSDARIEENLGAADLSLSPDELAEVEEALSRIVIHGNRTDEDIQRMGYVKPQ